MHADHPYLIFFIFWKMGYFVKHARSFAVIGITLYLLDYVGVLKHCNELAYGSNFNYPAGSPNDYNYMFLNNASGKCPSSPRLILIVKSAVGNVDRRNSIRRTWGLEHRFSDVEIRRVFLLGVSRDLNMNRMVESESTKQKDIVQIDFLDSYFNNTIKTMMGMRWALTYCGKSDYFFFVDDDYYVSAKNLLKFVADPDSYPKPTRKFIASSFIFAGFVMQTPPHRHKFSKWYVPLSEYPFDLWPPYITAGAFILNRNALSKLFNTAIYLKGFRFDDIFLGIAALKANLTLTHCDFFHFNKPKYKSLSNFQYTIASHGFDNNIELETIWNECRSSGFA
ncbi:beta-1,3-galactosyltransferase brn [Rhagoletis pomonella]|uniref:beta-1,3-galactosyltransferase brn n=1 Tax=Rhagoletis pomonella TaxID=28610 RepID=UPI00177F00F0|nr:beta-1,3-galactosyltransferase brn [Rhagoletis pomonella]